MIQHEGTYGVKQGKNKCKLCEHVFHAWCLEVPHASGYTSCKFPAVGWPNEDKEGEEEGGQQEEGSRSDGDPRRVGLQAKRRM
eukprot:65939-Pelagomonas_calceolata.AAC.7